MSRKNKVLLGLGALAAAGLAVVLVALLTRTPEDHGVLELHGNVDIREVQLAFHATGRIARMLVEEGQRVEVGELLAELDPVRQQAAVAQARAVLAAQEQEVAALLAGSRPEEIARARAAVKAAQAAHTEARLVYDRTRPLARQQYLPRQELDSASRMLKQARADLDRAEQALQLALEGPRQEDVAAARARLEASRASLALAEQELADTRLHAPVRGVVQQRVLEPGDMAFPQSTVLTLAIDDPIWVRAFVPEPLLGRLAPGMAARVFTDSFPGKAYAGWIGYVSPTAEFTPRQVQTTELRSKLVYEVRVHVCNPQHELRLGMPATVEIDWPQRERAATGAPPEPCRGE